MAEAWVNFSGVVRCAPRRFERPGSEAEVVALVRRAAGAGECVRVVGTGHSSMPLCATDDALVSLDDWQGVDAWDVPAAQATVRTGTKLTRLGALLLERGLAMANLGDIDVQSLGGALGTGTHGTGRALGNIASRALALRLVLASGEVVECSQERDTDLWRAARVSLGALGILSTARLQLQPAYRLHERLTRVPFDELLPQVPELIAGNRHFEFFWFPSVDKAEVKTLNPTSAEPESVAGQKYERIGWSSQILPSVREVKFHEMEYSVPAEAGLDCMRAARERLRAKHPDVVWPVEYRTVAPDDAWLSPAHGRATVAISIHQDGKLEYREVFTDLEPIFRDVGGRPHWGKFHTCGARELAARYPEYERFRALRARLDPKGTFRNAHLRELFPD